MKILILSQWCYPEDVGLKSLPFAKELKKQGHDVQILTGFPNYPGGKLYDGYKVKFRQKEIIDNIEIIRVPLYPSHDQSKIGRILNFLSFAFSATTIGLFSVKKADIMYVYHPPGTIALAAIAIKYLRRIPMVYDIQDLWPDTIKATGMITNDKILKIVGFYSKLTYKFINRIIVLSPGFKRRLVEYKVPESKIEVIYNWSADINIPTTDIQITRDRLNFKNKFIVLFAGNMGLLQGLESVLEAALLLKDEKAIEIVFIGGGVEVENLKEYKKKNKISNVRFLPRVKASEVGEILQASDVLLLHLIKDPLFEITIPSKIQAYLRIGKPILVGVEGDAADLVIKSKAGIACEPENPVDIANKIINLYKLTQNERNQMGNNGKIFYNDNLSIKVGTEKMIEVFKKVISKKI